MLVIHEWFGNLSLKQQTVLLSALRGCDGKRKEDISKRVTRFYRGVILKNADTSTSFMASKGLTTFSQDFELMLKDIDSYPVHFITHLIHGIEILGYHHPDESIRSTMNLLYIASCNALHFGIETKEQLDERLKDK